MARYGRNAAQQIKSRKDATVALVVVVACWVAAALSAP
jgi:hypothetical protein